MPDITPQETLDTNASEFRLNRFESAWRAGDAPPDWRQHLPADEETCGPHYVSDLLQIDIEYRIKAGLPALLAEHYFKHPRLQKEDVRLTDEQQVELIRWEYQLRRQVGQPGRRSEYEAAFPKHAEAVRQMKPQSRCPQCQRIFVLEETYQTRYCPTCESAPSSTSTSPLNDLDLRGYELLEALGGGGMGDVFRAGDPALGRDLAIKVIKSKYGGHAEAERRFLREARVTGSLQHPGIVPVYNLGRLSDGRLHYTMRLVRGDTFADILTAEAGKPERLPDLLSIFEKICQAVAYAHSKRVIHRDLKPQNVMVGKFGEVQVMDWGLAKVLTTEGEATESGEAKDAVGTRIFTESADTPADLSRTGRGLGTLPYMPSEQARGKWDAVDERADVFALGSILCEILTGQPAYIGTSFDELCDRVERGDVAEALQRLQQCGADAALTALCRECLSLKREDRPRDAAAVAKGVAEYQAEVQERLRRAELERVAAETRAREEQARALVEQERMREALGRVKAERRAKRRTLALAAAVVLLLAGGGGAIWWQQYQRERADLTVSNGLTQAELLAEQARTDPLQTDKYHQSLEVARVAARLAESASVDTRRRAKELVASLEQEEEAALRDRRLLAALLEAHGPGRELRYHREDRGLMMVPAGSPAEEQLASAFRDWGVDVEKTSTNEIVNLLKVRPPAVVLEIVAALDAWISERQRQGKPQAEWQRLATLAAALDKDPGSKRSELREILAHGQLPMERALGTLSAMLRPVPVPVDVPLGTNRIRLRLLVDQTDPAMEPVLGLLILAQALHIAGDDALAERLLRGALQARPREVVIYHTLAQFLVLQHPPRWNEAAEFYRAIRALRPELGVGLLDALIQIGRDLEGVALAKRLVKEHPNDPYFLIALGAALQETSDIDGAITCYKRAIAINPKYAVAHYNLGGVLHYKRDLEGAISCYRRALEIDPNNVPARCNLGFALYGKGDLNSAFDCCKQVIALYPQSRYAHNLLGDILKAQKKYGEAETAYHMAIEFEPDYAEAYVNLGIILGLQGKFAEAELACNKAIAIKPDYVEAYRNLGVALNDQKKYAKAEMALRKAIALKPDYAQVHFNLAISLGLQGKFTEAEAACRKAIDFKPDYADAYNTLGVALNDQGKHVEAEAACRKAIALKPDFALAYCSLGYPLRGQGRFAESLVAFRQGHELGSKQLGWRYPSLQWVRHAERIVELEKKLPAIIQGGASPANASDAITLAWICSQPYKKRYAVSARLYVDAFAADPKLAANNRYDAACSAALAASGQGEDARSLPDKSVAMLRRWALDWLRDDLTAYAKLAARNNPKTKQEIQQRLAHWRSDADLASVRDPSALDHLADSDRAAWQALWRDVDELAKQAARQDKAEKPKERKVANPPKTDSRK